MSDADEKEMLRAFCEMIGGEGLRRLRDGRWTFVVRHTVTAEDVRRSGLTRESAFMKFFDKVGE